MRVYDLIKSKRDGRSLSRAQIEFIVDGYAKGEIPDYQVSAFLMAVYFKGLNSREVWDLTSCMMRSGRVLDLSGLAAPKIDKHSTGGVGDKVSLILAPLAAAAGLCVPMMSGRALGHTGGTLDKLAAIRGLRVDLSETELMDQLKRIGVAMIGQTRTLAPADRKLYALRDVTATVDCIPLIAASIMSKKLAEGIDGLVLDIKLGSGAFMKTRAGAFRLARSMVEIGRRAGRRVIALITDMDQPLGRAIGNSLEVEEAIRVLRGAGPDDVRRLCVELGAWMLKLGGLERQMARARTKMRGLLDNGAGLKRLKEMVSSQGGNKAMIEDTGLLPRARHHIPVRSRRKGYVSRIQAEAIGMAAMMLGAGRLQLESEIDPAVGIMLEKKRGHRVGSGEVLAVIHSNDERRAGEASRMIEVAYTISHHAPRPRPLIERVVGG